MDEEEVRRLVLTHVRAVMALPDSVLSDATRLVEDLHADSLDLVEVVENVEQELAGRGLSLRLSDGELLGLRTLGDAVRVINARVAGRAEGRKA